MKQHLATSAVRKELSEILNDVKYGHNRVLIERQHKPVAALIPVEDLERLERLEREEEDRLDNEAADRALAEPGAAIAWKQAKKDLGL